MNILKKFLPRWLKIFIIEHRYMFDILKSDYKNDLKNLINENKEKSLSIDDEKKWIEKLNRLAFSSKEFIEIGKLFATSEITILKDMDISKKSIIAICVEKNDILRLKKFIEHHRSIGIDRFIILDNDSNDGSVEWLLQQDDVILLQTKVKYSSTNRVTWINRIIAHYGDERWYLVADSDELLVYNDYENKTIKDVIDYCKNSNIIRARAIMVDMYAKPEFYVSDNIDNYYDECIYFDKDTYYLSYIERFVKICGGPRERVFDTAPCLTKYPLFYFRKKDVFCKSHFLYPFKDNLKSECQLVLKHYKFLPNELRKYKRIALDGNYYNGSAEYKKYLEVMEKDSKLNFICDSTEKYVDSESLDNINVYKKIDWNNEKSI